MSSLTISWIVFGVVCGGALLFNGWSWVMLGILVKGHAPAAPPGETKTPQGVSVGMS